MFVPCPPSIFFPLLSASFLYDLTAVVFIGVDGTRSKTLGGGVYDHVFEERVEDSLLQLQKLARVPQESRVINALQPTSGRLMQSRNERKRERKRETSSMTGSKGRRRQWCWAHYVYEAPGFQGRCRLQERQDYNVMQPHGRCWVDGRSGAFLEEGRWQWVLYGV